MAPSPSGEIEREENQKDNSHSTPNGPWRGPPPPPPVVATDVTCQGFLAITLHKALTKVSTDNEKSRDSTDASSTVNDETKDIPVAETEDLPSTKIDDEFISSVMNSFGQSILKRQTEQYESMASGDSYDAPPAAILQGRIESYNRSGTKWKIEMKDVKLRRRKPLPRTRPKQRRYRKTIWWYHTDNDNDANKMLVDDDEIRCSDLEVLAYNDNDESK